MCNLLGENKEHVAKWCAEIYWKTFTFKTVKEMLG
jgi:hypothetical protein